MAIPALLRHSTVRFGAFGALGLAIDLALLALLHRFTDLPVATSVTIAFATTYLINFALNRRFTFLADGHVGGQLARFAPQVAVDYLLTVAAVETLTSLGLGLLVARFLAGGTNAVFNYCTYRWWTFRRSGSAAPSPPDPVERGRGTSEGNRHGGTTGRARAGR